METKKIIQNLVICSTLLIACLYYNPIFAQVAINTDGTPPDESAMLDVKSTEKGLLPPRVADTNAITNPAEGLLIYDLSSHCMRYYNGTSWSHCMGSFTPISPSWNCGDALVDDRDSQTYTTVQIGSQCWTSENMNYATTNSWWYDDLSSNGDVYGRLYAWNEAALTACPDGWHLPTDDEWKTLEMYLGMTQSEADDEGNRGTDEGGKLKEAGTAHWNSPNTGATNLSGFTALPGGKRGYFGGFGYLGHDGYWWSATVIYSGSARSRYLHKDDAKVYRTSDYKTIGFSVRCLRD